ncbi:hypothetical protein COMNV_00333 [Commensalibacter sp. Nvir]|uniref:hypothetical protein n=1 Tax=Commensalibacter sp. Nvir TaxID=3069817 RepID=UPI002D595251|nr:hypothetical protein COMNV_00333 [Commensalibacter sp. Nvir]
MNSVSKISLLVAALAFAVPTMTYSAMANNHNSGHRYYKGHRHNKRMSRNHSYNDRASGSQETADLNARSLQEIQSQKNNTVAVVPNNVAVTREPPAVTVVPQQTVPGTGNTMAPLSAPAGSVNPNNMPPVQY